VLNERQNRNDDSQFGVNRFTQRDHIVRPCRGQLIIRRMQKLQLSDVFQLQSVRRDAVRQQSVQPFEFLLPEWLQRLWLCLIATYKPMGLFC
jgi:hypothetical protein